MKNFILFIIIILVASFLVSISFAAPASRLPAECQTKPFDHYCLCWNRAVDIEDTFDYFHPGKRPNFGAEEICSSDKHELEINLQCAMFKSVGCMDGLSDL